MSYSSEVLADSPHVYYRLGESSGTTASDASGNGRTGTYSNSPTLGTTGLLTGDSDTAASFASASSQFATTADDNSLDGLTALTIEAWIKPTTLSGYPQIVSRDALSGAGRCWQWRINASTGKLEFIRIPGTTVTASSSSTISAGTAYHVAVVYNGTDVRLYINGVLDGTPAACTGSIGTSTTDLIQIAARRSNTTGSPSDFFNGVIDEVAVYTTALSSTRIAAHYTAGTTAANAASGTASLSLTASGGAGATGAGSVTLSLSASGGTSAVAAGSASLSLSASGALTPPTPAAGAAALVLSASGGAAGSPGGAASLNLIATGTALAVMAASGSATLTLSASGSAVMSAGGTAVLTLTAGGIALALYETDTSNALDGLDLLLTARVIFAVPIATPPTSLAAKYDKALAYPTPTMVGGRPT